MSADGDTWYKLFAEGQNSLFAKVTSYRPPPCCIRCSQYVYRNICGEPDGTTQRIKTNICCGTTVSITREVSGSVIVVTTKPAEKPPAKM
jgi:hypothetical protein